MKVAIIHDWLTGMRGGEAVLEAILELFPKANIFTLIHKKGSVSKKIESYPIYTSFLSRLPGIENYYRNLLPLFPHAIQAFDLKGYELIVSSSHCVAKGVKKSPNCIHVSYVHAPMRYIWDRFEDYFDKGPKHWVATLIRPYLQRWDVQTSRVENVDYFIANSRYIAEQMKRIYQRDSEVIYPFLDLEKFPFSSNARKNYYLVAGAMAPYKRVDLAIDAFSKLKIPLKIVGSGQEEKKLKNLINGDSIEFLGNVSDQALSKLYQEARGFVFPGLEDFGITPLEAMASGTPVIAFRGGGALETVIDLPKNPTGLFFDFQTTESLMNSVQLFESKRHEFKPENCRARAELFSKIFFQDRMKSCLANWKISI